MTAITVGDTYGEAIRAGASNVDATIIIDNIAKQFRLLLYFF